MADHRAERDGFAWIETVLDASVGGWIDRLIRSLSTAEEIGRT